MSKRKFREGEKFYTIIELVDWLEKGNSIYFRGKYLHNGWVISLKLKYLMLIVSQRVVTRAIRIEK